ncbi:MAG: sigma 54-interacting transcriptional regulator [Gammaproteobacteria bacterium (ex Lamellibrachia satsuma)]|nr:MAG: sigma 54-interacting transcriptional regulator [Gammaproteobacteria bacterium (ex Lamellibrachia satsuma)]
MAVAGSVIGAVTFASFRTERPWADGVVQQLRLVGEIFSNALSRKQADESLQKAFLEIQTLQQQLQVENVYLREEVKGEHNVDGIIGQSEVLKSVLFRAEQVASSDTTVLLLGETGVGKELVARAIHQWSPRKARPLVKVNCASLPANLIESELFGHEKGAFTGAEAKRAGRFEVADGGTLFLDEIGELPLELQSKLLRVLQDGEFERLGSSRTIPVNVRVITATNRELEEEVRSGRFRKDLYYRLQVFPITVPPLRERREDIPLLVGAFVEKLAHKSGKSIDTVPTRAMEALQRYPWPGNVRELQNVIERAVINTQGPRLRLMDTLGVPEVSPCPRTLAESEACCIVRALEVTHWKIEGESGAAKALGVPPSTLRKRMQKHGIHRPPKP